MPIPDSLRAAFHDARYVIFAPGANISLRIGQHSAPLASLMAQHGANAAAILTAFNPLAQPASAEANRQAQQSLLRAARAFQLPCLDGENIAAEADAPSEPSVAILGLRRTEAETLARQFRQLAFVYAETDGIPELAWIEQP